MIGNQTLFILGAGAHVPYGMPDGNRLTLDIINELPEKPPQVLRIGGVLNFEHFQDIYIAIHGGKIPSPVDRLFAFRKALQLSGHSSIDSFLVSYAKEDGFPEIGKLAVAKVLLPREFKTRFERGAATGKDKRNWDWMSYLFGEMYRGTDGTLKDFQARNKVAFVTFNYDRTLEHFFHLKLQYTFKLTPEDTLEALSKIEIHHVYGSLGEFDPEDLREKELGVADYQAAAKNIHLMYEDRGKTGNESLERANNLWDISHSIIFLGFAFDEQNIKILRMNRDTTGKVVAATRFGVADGDWERAMSRLRPNRLGIATKRDWDSLLFLQETVPPLF